MATTKFATMLHKTHGMTLTLVHAALEWILILMLHLHSLLSYLILKFSTSFGLTPPHEFTAILLFSRQSSGAVLKDEDDNFIPEQQNEAEADLCVSEEAAPAILSECELETGADMVDQVPRHIIVSNMETSSMGKPAEESRDGGALSIEKLKEELEKERNTLSALYVELEEEKSAAAVAANQTMAMITRLQEEKAALQMEALQYQRMMEEQAEYDQEALQLLNELVVKREKEKEELEREVEVYKEKALITVRRNGGSVTRRTSLDSCRTSISEDKDNYNSEERNENDARDLKEKDVEWTLDESMAEFEEERLSILDELKELEEKLFALADREERLPHGVKMQVGDFSNDFDESYSLSSPEETHVSQDCSEFFNQNDYLKRKTLGFEAERWFHSNYYTEEGLDVEKGVDIAEHIDHVYERLQALEADREFLKVCVSSIKRGDSGVDILQEILQHLRDLRNVEFQVRDVMN